MNSSEQKIFIDSNIWLYRFLHDPKIVPEEYDAKRIIAISLTKTEDCRLVISTQIINEICAVLKRKTKILEPELLGLIEDLEEQCEIIHISTMEIKNACSLREKYFFSYWDSLVIATALKSSASILYSEDMHHGLVIRDSLEIINPFYSKMITGYYDDEKNK
jgi:predicted nucleic acid-binding protein